MRKKLIMLTAMMLVIFSMATVANAAIFSSKYISYYYANAKAHTGGLIVVAIDINATDTMNKVGAQTIIMQEKSPGSSNWNSIDTLTSDDYSNMMATNSYQHAADIYYYGATPGYQYRAKVYFYAEKGGYDTGEYITPSVTAR
jgi:hypothetical protein